MSEIRGLAHVGVRTKDQEAAKRFYTDVLGFEVIWECTVPEADGTTTQVTFLRNGDLTIEAFTPEQEEERGDGRIDHIAMRVKDIERVQKKLLEKGIEFETAEPVHCAAVFENGSKWLMFRGPSGERLEIAEVL